MEGAVQADLISPFVPDNKHLFFFQAAGRQQSMAHGHSLGNENGGIIYIDLHGRKSSTIRFSVTGQISRFARI